MKLSIIIPVYNGDKYVSRCLDSLLPQCRDNNNVEVVVVDDGSVDQTPKILAQYAAQYQKNVKYVWQRNGGLSDARNSGFHVAEGEYVWYVDSDDVVCEGAVLKIFEVLRLFTADYYVFNANAVDQCGSLMSEIRHGFPLGEVGIVDFNYRNCMVLFCKNMVFTKVYRKAFVKGVRFPKGLTHEDIYYDLMVFSRRPVVFTSNDFIYNYYHCNPGSITNTMDLEKFNHVIDVFEKLINDVESAQDKKCVYKVSIHRLFRRLLYIYSISVVGKGEIIDNYNRAIGSLVIRGGVDLRYLDLKLAEKISIYFSSVQWCLLSKIINWLLSRLVFA